MEQREHSDTKIESKRELYPQMKLGIGILNAHFGKCWQIETKRNSREGLNDRFPNPRISPTGVEKNAQDTGWNSDERSNINLSTALYCVASLSPQLFQPDF